MRKEFDKKYTIEILRNIDDSLSGYQKRFPVYLLGGSALILKELQEFSKDMDFITTAGGCIAMADIILKLERKRKIKIDVFKDGEFPDYRYDDYYLKAEHMFSLRHLEVYVLDYADIILTKCITNREPDLKTILVLKKDFIVPKNELIRRYNKIVPSKDKEEEFRKRFENFLNVYYK